MATKTTKTITTPTAAPKLTAAEILARIEKNLALQIRLNRAALAKEIAAKREVLARLEALTAEETPDSDIAAASVYMQSYWGMNDTASASGKLQVYGRTVQRLDAIKKETTDVKAIVVRLLDDARKTAINDTYRHESSSNPFSNALSVCNGSGRGEAYREIVDMLDCYLEDLA